MSETPLRILCFGDSLTSGWTDWGDSSHPYSLRLHHRLSAAFPIKTIDISTSGIPGDVVSGERFRNRLKTELSETSYDWVIMLGGTNDIALCLSGTVIFQALKANYDLILQRSKVLALTVPDSHHKIAWVNDIRNELNEAILTHKAKDFHAFNLNAHTPYHSLSEKERDEYWDDGLHLSAAGYDWMGDHIADALLPLLEQPFHAKPTSQTGGQPVFDEEDGNTKNISQGYIVVRKSELE